MIIRIPKVFYDDCVMCETLVPPIIRETKAHYFIDTSKAANEYYCEGETAEETMGDFISRAHYYSENFGFCEGTKIRICPSARATLAAIEKAGAA
tara:strand:+ start:1551 stop:1835 length:285 start_codon:yes stop_codon:yes gene_type:complete